MIRKASFWIYAICVVLSFVGAFVVSQQLQASKHLVSVVETVNTIQPYKQLTTSDLMVVQVPEISLPSGSFNSVSQAVNSFANQGIPKGVPLTSDMLYKNASTPTELIKKVGNQNQVLVSIPVQTNDIFSAINQGDNINLVSVGKVNAVVKVQVISVVKNPQELFVLMDVNDYSTIVANLNNIRLELPVR